MIFIIITITIDVVATTIVVIITLMIITSLVIIMAVVMITMIYFIIIVVVVIVRFIDVEFCFDTSEPIFFTCDYDIIRSFIRASNNKVIMKLS